MLNKINGYLEQIIGNKHLALGPRNESKEKRKKYEELWIKIKDLIRSDYDYDEKCILYVYYLYIMYFMIKNVYTFE